MSSTDIFYAFDNRFYFDLVHILQGHNKIGFVAVDDDSKMNVAELLVDRDDQLWDK